MQSRNQGNYRNPCLTMHQPWASLLVYGIKRIEGRSWPAPIRGRLWIHAAGKVPDESTIKAMEEFYREIYAVNGITEIKFPEHYPVSRLLGCVEVVGCVRGEELARWDGVPEGVRLEALTDFCWLCEQPQKLVIPFEMRGYQKIYNLEKKIYEAAARGLIKVESPLPVKFPLPNPRDHFSLKPGSLLLHASESKQSVPGKSSSLSAAIAGARAAATQFSKNQNHSTSLSPRTSALNIDTLRKVETAPSDLEEVSDDSIPRDNEKEFSGYNQTLTRERKQQAGPSSKIFAEAVRALKSP
ncbi:uncharacterized protein LOC115743940 isoform X1 [Rhodamnia argentea]|uniref:Uncharacterized protein LOC115743940 isoform X1 n=1 Tax=Rhodamnia argentea TaxID=178133 RepID=A0A8B8PKA1_9MYRT|nr:uncharacterized protein LOC115743940 isoform X1 [Rhodamnia argentea]